MNNLELRKRRIEASQEVDRLKANAHKLVGILTPQAIMAVWLLLGDEMWVMEDRTDD